MKTGQKRKERPEEEKKDRRERKKKKKTRKKERKMKERNRAHAYLSLDQFHHEIETLRARRLQLVARTNVKHFEKARVAKGGDVSLEEVAGGGEVGAVDAGGSEKGGVG